MATLAANKNTSKEALDHHQCLFLGRNFPKKIVLCFGGNSYKGIFSWNAAKWSVATF
jgi:hypothetical protein